MTDELKFPDASEREPIDETLAHLIGDAYAPPVSASESEAYWARLEQRIMSKVAEIPADTRWWTVLAPWARTGLIAAAAIFALAGVINQQLGEDDSQLAYDTVVEATTPDVLTTSQELLTLQNGTDGDGAAVRYFLSH
jgi:hypothetical protein